VKPILSHVTDKLKEEDGDTDMKRKIKEQIKADLELRYINENIEQLLELTTFLDP